MIDLEKLLEINIGYAYSLNEISLSTMLKNIEKGEFILTNMEEKEIPLEATIYKLVKGLPINIISTANYVDGKICWNIIKGSNELRNIIQWVQGEIVVKINGKNAIFKDLDENSKKFLLEERRSLISIIIDSKKGRDTGVLSCDDLMSIVQNYF